MENLVLLVQEHGKKLSLTKGLKVFQMWDEANYIYYLQSGWVKIGKEAEDGQDITLTLRQAGELFGLTELLADTEARTSYASSLTDIVFYMISKEQLFTILEKHPSDWQTLCRIMAERLIETQNFVGALTNLPVPERIGWFLQRFVKQVDDELVIEVPLTHEEMSYLVGCSRQKITSNLNAWRNAGYITYERGKITVLEEDMIFPDV